MRGSPSFRICWLGHATALIELDGMRVLTDPVLRHRVGPLVRIPATPPVPAAVDIVLLSHLHADHVDVPTLRRLSDSPTIIAPDGSGAWLRRQGFGDVHELRPRESIQMGRLTVRATPAVHDSRRHPLGRRATPIGYVVAGSRTAYYAGDTDLFAEMESLRGEVEVALLPVWGWGPGVGAGHLDPARATQAVQRIAPAVAIPVHWGTYALAWSSSRTGDTSRPAREFAELVHDRMPEVDVRVLSPGQSTEL